MGLDQSPVAEHRTLSVAERKAIREIESMILEGGSELGARIFATVDLGLTDAHFEELLSIIVESWNSAVTANKRALISARLSDVHQKAIATWEKCMDLDQVRPAAAALSTASAALLNIAKLEGLILPSSDALPERQPITNQTRDTVVTLLERMKELGSRQTPHLPPGQTPGANLPMLNIVPAEALVEQQLEVAVPMKRSRTNTIVCLDCQAMRATTLRAKACSCGGTRWRAWTPDRDD